MPRFRPTARLLVLDPADRILLFSAEDPRGRFWFTPGGGLRTGENPVAAAARELAEETGHIRTELGLPVATSAGLWEAPDGQVFFGADSYFLVRVSEPSVDPRGQEPLERSVITGHRWWTAGELRGSGDKIVPAGLDELVDELARNGVPATPIRLPWRG
jgi:8-oxo-dGTP pyrophosphatase MutT (NUDIX family)